MRLIDAIDLFERAYEVWGLEMDGGETNLFMSMINDSKTILSLQDDDFGMILNCAVRYALGRKTYIPKVVCEFITSLLPYVNDRTLSCFDRDIEDHGKNFNFGEKHIDEPVWMKFHDAVVKELNKRRDRSGIT